VSVIQQLITEFSRLPGVGSKTAQRFGYYLLKRPREEAFSLAAAIREVAEKIGPCEVCGNFTESKLCEVCSNPNRDEGVVCVVEEAYEVGAIERAGGYRGVYHVLGGRLSPLDGVGPDEINVTPLLERIRTSGGAVKEVVVATNSSVEGEATAVYLEGVIRPLGPRVTRLARGLPVGSELEYVDGSTIVEALAGRREM
jgi:recombination protein RecR